MTPHAHTADPGFDLEPASFREFISVALMSASLALGAVAAGCQLGLWLQRMPM